VDERDISMDKNVREEYKQRMGGPPNISALPVPQVFIGQLYIGGHTVITEMNEIGELKPILMVRHSFVFNQLYFKSGGIGLLVIFVFYVSHHVYRLTAATAPGAR
jgi:glutaredoxin